MLDRLRFLGSCKKETLTQVREAAHLRLAPVLTENQEEALLLSYSSRNLKVEILVGRNDRTIPKGPHCTVAEPVSEKSKKRVANSGGRMRRGVCDESNRATL